MILLTKKKYEKLVKDLVKILGNAFMDEVRIGIRREDFHMLVSREVEAEVKSIMNTKEYENKRNIHELTEDVKNSLDEYISSEPFIDSLVRKINKKQLK